MKKRIHSVFAWLIAAALVAGMTPAGLVHPAEAAVTEDHSVGEVEPAVTASAEYVSDDSVATLTEPVSGYCGGEGDGTNLTWELTEDGVLTISGEGAMEDWASAFAGTWYKQRSSIKTVVIEDSVTTIGNWAFYSCNNLTAVTIPASVTTIGYGAFSFCDALTTVTIPDSVTTIGVQAFECCTSLMAVDIPDSVTTILANAFWNCTSLTVVEIPASVAVIGGAAFGNCANLTDIYFAGEVPTFSKDVFGLDVFYNVTATAYYPAGNDTWTEDVMQDYGGDITWKSYIPVIASGYCGGEGDGTNLTWELTEDGVLTISGEGAMADWENHTSVPWDGNRQTIQSVIIGDSVTAIDYYAFYHCWNLTEVTIPDSVTTIGDSAFSNCLSLNEVTIPDSVTFIGDSAFASCDSLTIVTIPDSVTLIGGWAFYGCDSLTEVTIPDSVIIIGTHAFSRCDSLAAIHVDEDNRKYSSDSFGALFNKNKTALIWVPRVIQTYEIPDSVTNIGGSAFSSCEALTIVTIPGSVTTIGDFAFNGCSSLTSVIIPDSVTFIGDSAFSSCEALTIVTIPDSVTTIGVYAYAYCDSLTEIRFKGDAPEFGEYAFEGTTTTAYYPAGNETWTDEVMQDYGGDITWVAVDAEGNPVVIASGYCGGEGDGTNLTWALTEDGTLTISGEGKMKDWASFRFVPWYSHTNFIKTVVIEDDVTTIGDYAFSFRSELTSVTIPDSVTSIGNYAFYSSNNLTTVTIPTSVTTIGDYAFSSCTSLSEIRFEGDAPAFDGGDPSFGYQTFGGVTATAYYPASNETWTADVMQDYGGDITWVPIGGATIRCDSCTVTGTTVTVNYDPTAAEIISAFIVIYDKNGKMMRCETVTQAAAADGTMELTISYSEEEAVQIGEIAALVTDGHTMAPLCANWNKKVYFGTNTDAYGRYPAETVKIGFVHYDPYADAIMALKAYFNYLDDYLNFEIIWSEPINSAGGELAFIDACAAAGCCAIIGYYSTCAEEAVQRCEDLGMYYWGQGGNKELTQNQELMKSPYYLGGLDTANLDYEYGYGCIEMLVEAGCHKIAGVSGAKSFGVQLFIDRWQGALDAIEDYRAKGYDIELVYEVQGFPGTDGAFEAGQAAVLGMPEVDGVYSTLTALMWIHPTNEAGRFGQLKFAAAGETMSEGAIGMFGAGFYVGTATEIIDVFGMGIPLIINAVEGHPIRNADGTAPLIKAGWWKVTNVQDAGFYGSVQGGENGWVFTAEDIYPLLVEYCPSVTIEDYENLYTAVTADEIRARHAN